MCYIPQNSGRINVMHSQLINIGGYNWAGFGLNFVTDWAGKKNNNLATPVCIINNIKHQPNIVSYVTMFYKSIFIIFN